MMGLEVPSPSLPPLSLLASLPLPARLYETLSSVPLSPSLSLSLSLSLPLLLLLRYEGRREKKVGKKEEKTNTRDLHMGVKRKGRASLVLILLPPSSVL